MRGTKCKQDHGFTKAAQLLHMIFDALDLLSLEGDGRLHLLDLVGRCVSANSRDERSSGASFLSSIALAAVQCRRASERTLKYSMRALASPIGSARSRLMTGFSEVMAWQ